MNSRSRFALVAALCVSASSGAVAQEGKSLISDLMNKGKGAFNDLKYRQADSLSRRVLSYSALLTKEQKVEAMQLLVASVYPEDESEQKADTAIHYIKQLVSLGATKGIPRELSHPGLDSLWVWIQRASSGPVTANSAPATPAPAVAGPAEIRLGSPTPEAFLYVNDKIQGPISSIQYWKIPGGENVKLSIRSTRCMTPWDTTVNVAPGTQAPIGRRLASQCQ